MKNCMIVLLLILFSFSQCTAPQAQDTDTDSIVAIKTDTKPLKVERNGQMKVACHVAIKKGWHINSSQPNDDFLIPSSLTLKENKGFRLSGVNFPDAKNIFLSFSEAPVSVFEGEIVITAIVDVSKDLSLGKHTITLVFEYQACDDTTCKAPEVAEFDAEIVVTENPVL